MATHKWFHSPTLHLTLVTVSRVRCSPKHILYYMLDAQLFPQPRLLPQSTHTLCFMLDGYLNNTCITRSSASAHNLQRTHKLTLINILEVRIFPNL